MAEPTTSTPVGEATTPSTEAPACHPPRTNKPRGPPLNQIYSQPAPIKTYPLPSFYPGNPLSLIHLVYTWVKQTIFPPASEPSVIHQGVWNPETRSVHILDQKTIRALWEQGFYGKGSLSRSDPNWLKREQIRRGAEGDVSEQRTAARREERRQVKWERARIEQEALEKTRLEEALLAASSTNLVDAALTASQPPASSVTEEPSTTNSSDDLGFAQRSAAEFEPEISLPSAPGFPSENSQGLELYTSLLDIPVLSATVSETVNVIAVPEEPLDEPSVEEPSVEEPSVEQETIEEAPEETLQEAIAEALEKAAQETVQEAVQETVEETVEEAIEDAIEEVINEALLETVDETVHEAVKEALHEAVSETVQESVQEAVEESIEEAVEEILEDLPLFRAPVGPLELLALPNSAPGLRVETSPIAVLEELANDDDTETTPVVDEIKVSVDVSASLTVSSEDETEPIVGHRAPVGPLELLALPNSSNNLVAKTTAALETVWSDVVDVIEEIIETVLVAEPTTEEPTTEEDATEEPATEESITEELAIEESCSQTHQHKAPVSPLELLALPNSLAVLHLQSQPSSILTGVTADSIETVSEATPAEVAQAGAVPNGISIFKAPVGPLELLALPNSLALLRNGSSESQLDGVVAERVVALTTDVVEATAELASAAEAEPTIEDETGSVVAGSDIGGDDNTAPQTNGHANGPQTPMKRRKSDAEDQSVKRRKADAEKLPQTPQSLKRRKDVRFSSAVESPLATDKVNSSAPVATVVKQEEEIDLEEGTMVLTETVMEESLEAVTESAPVEASVLSETAAPRETPEIENKEHLQLSTEEAFFLSFGMGALEVLDPVTRKPIAQDELLKLFRSHSYFPPREDNFQPDDPFLVHYAVYHHFRSLGWVPRHGIKFGVDWMIYQRGPVFDHAEFGAMVMPAYSDPWWKEQGKQAEKKSWSWLHGVNRVLSHVLKSLVLVYVDVPTPATFDAAMAEGGIAGALKAYKVREFMVRRWSSNRNR